MPNLRIIDVGYDFTGSAHNSTAWEKTKVYKQHESLLGPHDFVWGESAYPVSILNSTYYKSN
jgi:hypothetical protein